MARRVNRNMNLKNVNRLAVLSYIRHKKSSTRTNLANETGLSFMGIKIIIEELEELGLLKQGSVIEGEAEVGRKPVTYVIDKDYGYTIGVHINLFTTRVAILDLQGEILNGVRMDMSTAPKDSEGFVDALVHMIQEVIVNSGMPFEKILGVGIGTPGPVDVEQGKIESPPNFPVFRDYPLRDVLEERLDLRVYVHKDTNTIAMGEFWRGIGMEQGVNEMLYIDADMGIGSGLIINDDLHRGFNSTAGEFGHVTIVPNGRVCNCGSRGCLETVSSGLSILDQVRQLIEHEEMSFTFESEHDVDQLKEILSAADDGNHQMIAILNQAAAAMGDAIGSLINFLDPELIILGGMLVYEYPLFFKIVRSSAIAKQLTRSKDVRLVTGTLRYESGVIGAGECVSNDFFATEVNSLLNKDE